MMDTKEDINLNNSIIIKENAKFLEPMLDLNLILWLYSSMGRFIDGYDLFMVVTEVIT